MQFFEPVYDNQINLWYQVIIKSISRKCSWIETAPNRIMGFGAFDFELRSKSHEPVPHMHNPHRLPGFLIRGSHRIRSHQRVGGAVQSWSCQCWVIKLSFLRLVKKKWPMKMFGLQVERETNFKFLQNYLSTFVGDFPTQHEVEDCQCYIIKCKCFINPVHGNIC